MRSSLIRVSIVLVAGIAISDVCFSDEVQGDPAPAIQALIDRMDALEQRSDTLEMENARLRAQIAELKAQRQEPTVAADEVVAERSPASGEAPTAQPRAFPEIAPAVQRIGLGGQYRVNFYSVDSDLPGESDNQTAARLRLRQNVDIGFNEQFRTHVQFELQNTTDNVTTTDFRRGGKETNVSVRHAVMDYTVRSQGIFDGAVLQAGLLPLQDEFHQTQFSADWDYNPLAAAFIVPTGSGSLRLFAANLDEGSSESDADDDFVHYQADLSVALNDQAGITLTGTALNIADAVGGDSSWHYNYGIGGHVELGGAKINGFVLGASTQRGLLGNGDASGVAALLELTGAAGAGNYGLLVSHASGERDGTGFLMPMAFAQTFGYWGYTGILTVQGPTDTGFDFDGVNMSNNGYGLTSAQARYAFPINANLRGYLAAGWFGNTDAPSRNDRVGIDFLAMLTYRFNNVLALDLGADYARLEDSVSGYFQGVQGGAAFNQAQGVERDKFALFGRLQAEF